MKQPKVAIVHDWLYGGGAELVVEQLHKLYPEAPIYTSFCTQQWRERLNNKVVTGYLQRWPFAQLRKFLPVLRQYWFKHLDLSEFDLVISSSGNGEARFVLPNTRRDVKSKKLDHKIPRKRRPLHVSYTHTPTHFYWRKYEEYLKNPSFKPKWLVRIGLKLLVKPLRKRDYQAAQSVDYFIANSSHIQKDIKLYYDRDSTVIHPPVNIEMFTKKLENTASSTTNDQRTGFITWGRHVPYKRFDLAIEACNALNMPLTVVGTGPETEALKKIAGRTVTFTGRVSDEELVTLAHQAKAFLFPGEEDFGIAPVEALAEGIPVIAYKSGGALDYVTEGITGIFFEDQTVESLKNSLKKFDSMKFNYPSVAEGAQRFSNQSFQSNFKAFIASIG